MSTNTLPSSSEADELKYIWFAAHLRRQIEEGELKPGDRLPSRNKIRELHNLAQPTIERALAILEREGLVMRRERQGVFVAERSATPVSNGAETDRVAARTIGIFTVNDGRVGPNHVQMGWSDYITQGALAACRDLGKHALLLDPERIEEEDLRELLDSPPLGFVFAMAPHNTQFERFERLLQMLKRSGQPVVVFGNETGFEAFDRVACHHEAGCYALTKWLIERGCERILPFWPPMEPGSHWLRERLEGYRRAMTEAGLEPLPVRSVPMRHSPFAPDMTPEAFEATARHKVGYLADYLGARRNCDAILEVTDGEVCSTIAACRLLGCEPNEDVLIAGYDNYWRDAFEVRFEPTPPIATVDKHNWLTGSELVKVLMARVAGELPSEPQLHWIEPTVIPGNDPAQRVLLAAPVQANPVQFSIASH